jgi:hypothetical protein
MGVSRHRKQELLIAAAVLVLHGALCWLLVVRSEVSALPQMSNSLELIVLPAPPVSPKPTTHRQPPRTGAAARVPAQSPSTPEREESNAIHPPIDWNAELDREARESVAAGSSPKFKNFGFPPPPPARSKSPEFGWDYAATHRVQPLSGGGLLVNLNDNCVLVFAPLPFFFCRPGHKPADGDLFKHMLSPSSPDRSAPE